jgi:hypothetical protein
MWSPSVLTYTDFGNLMKPRKDILDEIVDLDVKRMNEKFFFNCEAYEFKSE